MIVKMGFAIDNVRYVCKYVLIFVIAASGWDVPKHHLQVSICSKIVWNTCN